MAPQIDAMKLHARLLLRDAIWHFANRHRQGSRPNIAIFGSRRSGSTLLMQVIASNRGLKSVDQPCSVFSASAHQVRQLPIRDCGQMHHLNEQEKEILRAYFTAIVAGDLHVNEPWRFWARDFWWRSDRIVFKLTDAHGAATWLTETFGWQPVILLRHPLSQALSVMNLNLKKDPGGWHSRAPGFFRSDAYCRSYLDDRQVARCHDVWARGTDLDRHVLGWVLENLPLLRIMETHFEWSFVSYEAMVLEPEAVVQALAEALGLEAEATMLARIGERSRSVRRLSQEDRQRAIREGDREALLRSWRRLPADDEARSFALLEAFGIDLYRAGEDTPRTLWRIGAERSRSAA